MSEALVTNYDEVQELKGQLAELRQNRTMKKLSETLIELGIDFSFPIEIKDANGNETYFEDSSGYWQRLEYDTNGKETYFEDNDGDWCKREYDAKGNQTYYENSNGDKNGTPRSQYCDGKVIEVDGKKYQLKEL